MDNHAYSFINSMCVLKLDFEDFTLGFLEFDHR